MAPVLSRSLVTASLASFPSSSPFSSRNRQRLSRLGTAFVPQNGLRRGFCNGGVKWKLEKRNNKIGVRCDAAVAEKESTDAPGEKFEYQAEVGFLCTVGNLKKMNNLSFSCLLICIFFCLS